MDSRTLHALNLSRQRSRWTSGEKWCADCLHSAHRSRYQKLFRPSGQMDVSYHHPLLRTGLPAPRRGPLLAMMHFLHTRLRHRHSRYPHLVTPTISRDYREKDHLRRGRSWYTCPIWAAWQLDKRSLRPDRVRETVVVEVCIHPVSSKGISRSGAV